MANQAPLWEPSVLDARTDGILERLMQLHPKSIDLSLGRVERLLERLGNPHLEMPPAIHIAGTNGKGSVLAYLAAALASAGKRVHTYTSPHLVRFSERIRLSDGGPPRAIDEPFLVELLEECEAANDGAPITFFEITTAVAFLAFSRVPADYVILETGLGGRLDATNVLPRPALTVITPVSIDHQSFLGESVEEIAGEKAGILKRGVTGIIGQQADAALQVIEDRSAEVGAPLVIWGQDFEAFQQHGRLVYQDDVGLIDLPPPRLFGAHQFTNAGIAVAALRALAPDGLGEHDIATGLERAEWPARLERLGAGTLYEKVGTGTEIWLDGGHNAAAGVVLAAAMADLEERVSRPLRLVVGMMEGKDVEQFLTPFVGLADQVVAMTIPGQENALSPDEIMSAAARAGLSAAVAGDLDSALAMASGDNGPARILLTGSLYLAGHVLKRHRGFAMRTKS